MNMLKKAVGGAKDAKPDIGNIEDKVKGIVEEEMEAVTKKIDAVEEKVGGIEDTVKTTVEGTVGEFKESIEGVINTLKEQLENAMKEIDEMKGQMEGVQNMISCLQCWCCCFFPSGSKKAG